MIIVHQNRHQGLLSGLLGCAFGILGIFTWGLIFVPLAAVCSLVGLLRGIVGLSISGIGCSLLGAVLTAWGFVVSPSLWLLLGVGILASHQPAVERQSPAPSAGVDTPRSAPMPPTNNDAQELAILAELQQVIPRINKFNGRVDALIGKLPAIEERYRAITVRMDEHLARKRQLAGIPDYRGGVTRSQISVAITQGEIATDQIHIQAQPSVWDFQNNVIPFRQQVIRLKNLCSITWPKRSMDSKTACDQIVYLAGPFETKFNSLSGALARLESTYQAEREAQQRIVDASNRIP